MEINGIELQEKINNGEKIIVDFYAQWCGPCKIMKPIFEKVANENSTDVKMFFMDVDQNREFAMNYGVRSVPTIKGFSSGKELLTKIGLQQEIEIKELIETIVKQ